MSTQIVKVWHLAVVRPSTTAENQLDIPCLFLTRDAAINAAAKEREEYLQQVREQFADESPQFEHCMTEGVDVWTTPPGPEEPLFIIQVQPVEIKK